MRMSDDDATDEYGHSPYRPPTHSKEPMLNYAIFAQDPHVDRSDEFLPSATLLLGFYWLACLAAIAYSSRHAHARPWTSWVAVACAASMVLLRVFFAWIEWGPALDLGRAFPLDPVIVLACVAVIRAVVASSSFSSDANGDANRSSLRYSIIYNRKNDSNNNTNNTNNTLNIAGYAFLFVGSGVAHLDVEDNGDDDEEVHHVITTTVKTLISMLTITGNAHSLLIYAVAYDQIRWNEYLFDMLLPIGLGLGLTWIVTCIKKCGVPSADINAEDHCDGDGDGEYRGISQVPHADEPSSTLTLELTGVQEEPNISIDGACSIVVDEENTHFARTKDVPQSRPNTIIASTRTTPHVHRAYYYGIALAMTLGYFLGGNLCLTTVLGTVFFVIVYYRRYHEESARAAAAGSAASAASEQHTTHQNTNEENAAASPNDALRANANLEPLFLYCSAIVLTAAVGDTSFVQPGYMLLLGQCAEQCVDGACAYRFALVQYALALLVSPVVAVACFAVTFPYAVPYEWAHVSFVVGVAHVCRAGVLARWRRTAARKKESRHGDGTASGRARSCWNICQCAVLSLGFLLLGVFSLTTFHWSAECSIRLGECA